ncbi:MAG: flagellar biosynthesis protein FlhF [Phycisphaerales bacterium]|nr:MAG: flagellar biosynthesis protein FlhF [Phycisphaerales bacterium]
MNLKTYQAYTMAEALAAVKRDLGADAVILNTRAFKRRALFGLRRKTVVEVTATTGGQAAPEADVGARSRRFGKGRIAHETYLRNTAGTSRKPEPKHAPVPAKPSVTSPGEDDRKRTQRLAQAMAEKHERARRNAAAEVASRSPAASLNEPQSPPAESPRPSAPRTPPASPEDVPRPVAKRYVLRSPDRTGGNGQTLSASESEQKPESGQVQPADPLPGAPAPGVVTLFEESDNDVSRDASTMVDEVEMQGMQEELTAIRQMVGQVLQRQVTTTGRAAPAMPQQLFEMYLKLIGQDLSEELADQVVNDVRDELSALELEDEELVRTAVKRHLADYIPAAAEPVPAHSPDGRPLTIALVGPTGVGKTTTLAKLAASFKLRHGRKVGLVTSDTYRIAAVDQLRTYANIIGLPLQVVLTPGEMRQAVFALSDCDVILIDTAGRSQNDDNRLAELEQFMAAAEPHEVHLVLSGTAGEKVLQREAEAFSRVGVDKIVLTKLDEAVSFGVLVNVIRRVGKELSFFTTGQEVPDHIELGRPGRLAELVLGGEVHQ